MENHVYQKDWKGKSTSEIMCPAKKLCHQRRPSWNNTVSLGRSLCNHVPSLHDAVDPRGEFLDRGMCQNLWGPIFGRMKIHLYPFISIMIYYYIAILNFEWCTLGFHPHQHASQQSNRGTTSPRFNRISDVMVDGCSMYPGLASTCSFSGLSQPVQLHMWGGQIFFPHQEDVLPMFSIIFRDSELWAETKCM